LLAALVGWGFVRLLSVSEDGFRSLPIPRWAQPTIAGLLVGAMGITRPEVWGNGYDATTEILNGLLPVAIVGLLLPAKAVSTSLTAGSGAVGGVFTPTLFLGAALGGTFGAALSAMLPHAHVQPGLYARDLVRTDAPALPAQAPLAKVLDVFLNSRRDALYVVGDGGRYVGVARIHDVKAVFGTSADAATIIAMDVAVPSPPVAEDEAVGAILARFDDPELDEVPVVASREQPRFVGALTRRDILEM